MAVAAKPKPFPKSMGACADLLHDKKQERLAADKAAALLKVEEVRLENYIIDNLDKASSGAVGRRFIARVKTDDKIVVEDWPTFYAYVAKYKAYDMLQKRLSEAAIQARLDDKKKVPGIGTFKVVKVSLTKV
jgi:hypothetical protein